MSRLLKKYNIHSGDILALKHQSENANKDAIEVITEALTRMELNVLVIVVNDFNDLTVLNEVEMGKNGWFRLARFSKISNGEKSIQ